MSTFITRFDTSGSGVRLAVKDLIDMEGEVTTAGCRAVARRALPAVRDAVCLAGARRAGARIVGRTNLHELALGVSGINPWYGTPRNPLDPALVPGGSSSGSAVAVADGECDVAYGTDTGGSVRIPAACCGIAGLKTTWGRVSNEGVWPLSPSFDTVGPLARDIAGLVLGMQLLEPGFDVPAGGDRLAVHPLRVGRLRVACDSEIDRAVDALLTSAGWRVADVEIPGWQEATRVAGVLLVVEAWTAQGALIEAHEDEVGDDVTTRMRFGSNIDESELDLLGQARSAWSAELGDAFSRFDLIATPTLTIWPPTIDRAGDLLRGRATLPVNLAGVPALSLPAPGNGPLPASLQLIAPHGGEELLLAAGAALEAAASR